MNIKMDIRIYLKIINFKDKQFINSLTGRGKN